MQIVIDIPEEVYNKLLKEQRFPSGYNLAYPIIHGTPLPKRHGDLIDRDEAIKTLKSLGNCDYRRKKGTIQEAEKMLSFDEYTPTIIEADKEGQT